MKYIYEIKEIRNRNHIFVIFSKEEVQSLKVWYHWNWKAFNLVLYSLRYCKNLIIFKIRHKVPFAVTNKKLTFFLLSIACCTHSNSMATLLRIFCKSSALLVTGGHCWDRSVAKEYGDKI